MYCGRDFSPADNSDSELYALDFVNDLPAGDSIIGGALTLTVYRGTDADPSSRLAGGFSVDGTKVIQRIRNLTAGVIYTLQIVVTTQQGNSISLFSHIPCEPVL